MILGDIVWKVVLEMFVQGRVVGGWVVEVKDGERKQQWLHNIILY